MANSSSESLIINLLEQIRTLEDERDKALQLAREQLKDKVDVNEVQSVGETNNNSDSAEVTETELEKLKEENEMLKGNVETITQAVLFDLEEIRLNEEQRRFNLKELVDEQQNAKTQQPNEDMNAESYRTMLDMCKKYYSKMVAELQEERSALQQKIEKQQSLLLDKDMKIAELEMKLQASFRK